MLVILPNVVLVPIFINCFHLILRDIMRIFNKIQMFVCDSHLVTLSKKEIKLLGYKLFLMNSCGHLVVIIF